MLTPLRKCAIFITLTRRLKVKKRSFGFNMVFCWYVVAKFYFLLFTRIVAATVELQLQGKKGWQDIRIILVFVIGK